MILNKNSLKKHPLQRDRCLLGVDFGSKILGFAISDGLLWNAYPLVCWERKKQLKTDLQFCKQLVTRHAAGGLVVGWPLRSDGSESEICKAVLGFCQKLDRELDVPLILWDERFSSQGAENILRSQGQRSKKIKSNLDKHAACHILQGCLDYLKVITQDREDPPKDPTRREI